MATYPAAITAECLEQLAHIGDEELVRDIAEAEQEIEGLRRQQAAEEEIARVTRSDVERRLAHFKATARPHQIAERAALLAFLRRLQDARKAVAAAGSTAA